MQAGEELQERLSAVYSRVSLEVKACLESDPHVQREDTCKGLMAQLEEVRKVMDEVNQLGTQERAKHYNVVYNAITYIQDIAQHLRKSPFAFESTMVLIEAIKSMEGNLILQDVKYLDRRTELYLTVSKIYEQGDYYQEASALLEAAIKSYKDLKAIHDLDQPVPHYVQEILTSNLKIARIYQIKYAIQAGSLSVSEWKKRVDEEFGDDLRSKLTCLVETLKTQTNKHHNVFSKNLKSYKQNLLNSGFEMVKPHMDVISAGLVQQKEKIQRQVNFRSTLNPTQQQINEQIKKRREIEEKYVKESELKKASEAFPFQFHAQLIHYALQAKNSKMLNDLISSASIRIECRRIEVPYVNDMIIMVSNSPYPNIPNGYTKIPIDLNEANLRKELAKLRKSGKKAPEDQALKQPQQPAQAKDEKKDPKKVKDDKKGKEQPKKEEGKKDEYEPSEWQLSEIKHKYVFMMIKKSMSPEEALYDMRVVMGDEEKGPVGYNDNRRIIVPYIQENMGVVASEVTQHTGVKESTGMVPYVILYHSRDGLQNQNQKKTLITDITPLIGKNPMVPAKWGYNKVDVDLRQVPSEFIKAPNNDYVYLTYKTDELFHINQRQIHVIKAMVELEETFGQRKGTSNQEDKLLELEINYQLDKLNLLFETLQESLRGDLGQEYYLHRTDFLTALTFEVWTKYLKNPLMQFDYLNEQRLNGQIIDYDYEEYRKVIEECQPIFLRGLKILNLIMVNNPHADILLQSKINLELAKLLEDARMYKVAAENLKLCLDRLRGFRDRYLDKGVDGCKDRLLPFALTTSNTKIRNAFEAMKQQFSSQRRHLEKMLRIRERRANGEKQLTKQELDEEEKQFIRLKKKDEFDEQVEKAGGIHSQMYAIVHAVELELLNLSFRVSLKRADEISRLEQSKNDMTNGIKNTELEGLGTTLKQKLGMADGLTLTKNARNLGELQGTLVQANKLPNPKPKLEKMKSKLIVQHQKNPYALVLLMVNLAAMNSDNQDKRYYLQEGLNYLKKCSELQGVTLEKAVDNAIFVFSSLWDSQLHQQQNSHHIEPFKDLYSRVWQQETEVPIPPILLNKNSTSIYLKLPPFAPKHHKNEPVVVKNMSVYGKPSANGVDVSLNCVELEGTGIRHEMGGTVRVSSLTSNNLYCFAAAGVDQSEQVMEIGQTGEDIGTFNPLSIPMLASTLAKVSYQINEHGIAEQAIKIVLAEYCQQAKYMSIDRRTNYLYYYTLKENALQGLSLLEIKSIANALYIAALCQRNKLNQVEGPWGVVEQEKEKLVTNLLMLSAMLSPSLSSPNMSIPLLLPSRETLLRAISVSMIPEKWMNPRMRRIGVGVMEKLLKWGVENNEITLARRLVWKWNDRKYLLLGKTLQVEEKKQAKKGAKDSKDEVKMIDKYCRLMTEKSPQLMEAFEDSMMEVSEEYNDFVATFIERAKDQVASLSQYIDNPTEEVDSISSHLSMKLELLEYLKEPLQSIGKANNTSPYYLEYNSRLLKKALQVSSDSESTAVFNKSQELEAPLSTPEVTVNHQILTLMMEAVENDIDWSPCAKQQLITFQEKTGKDLQKAIGIFTSWQEKKKQLTEGVSRCLTLNNKHKDFDYLNTWLAELNHLKAQALILSCSEQFGVSRPIRQRYDKVQAMNLEDLFKKETEVEVLEDRPYAYSEEQLKKLKQILTLISEGLYAAVSVQHWLKAGTLIKLLCNLVSYIEVTPFNHKGTPICGQFAFISLCAIQMLQRIRSHGFYEFRNRYHRKLANSEAASISSQLQLGDFQGESLIDDFTPEYYQPDLDPNTTKSFWFDSEQHLSVDSIATIVSYTVNCLSLERRHNLVINIVRDFCNVTQHRFSLLLLPFMVHSQGKLSEEVEAMIVKEQKVLHEVEAVYRAEKEKKGKKRAAMLSGEKMEFEVVYEEKSSKLEESLRLLSEQRDFLHQQMDKSSRIKEEISRDTSKQMLAQKEQKKYAAEFGEHYEQMRVEFGQQAKHVRKSKNFIKDIINKYEAIYHQLTHAKTTKHPLAEIQNRNDVGNLYYAAGHLEKAQEFWNDALATIFRKVNPIENYHEILTENAPTLVASVGEKEVLLAVCLLYKVSQFAAANQLHLHKASTSFACQLVFSLFQVNLDHPQAPAAYHNYRLKEFASSNILTDEASINLSELLAALQYFATQNIYEDNQVLALPLVTFFDFLATDVAKNIQFSVRAKLLKATMLADAGYIAESMVELAKVAHAKDLPILWLQASEFLKKEKGMNWVQESQAFNNCQFWTDPNNKTALQEFKKLALKPETTSQCGVLNPLIFSYTKALALFKIYEAEICTDEALSEQRQQNLAEAENNMRDTLRKLGVLEQFYTLLEEYEQAKSQHKQNEVSEQTKKEMEGARGRMIDYLKKNGVQQGMIPVYEKEQSSALKRSFRLELMCRIRFTLHRINEAKNLPSNSYFILKNGLTNMHRYSIGARLCENGVDPEVKAVAAPVAADKKDNKKGGKKEEEAPQVAAVPALDSKKEKELREKAEARGNRYTISAYWHIKYLFQVGRVLYRQNNFSEAIKLFENVVDYCQKYGQNYVFLHSQAYIWRAQLRCGNFQQAELKSVVSQLEEKQFFDENYLTLVMDIGELLSGRSEGLQYLQKGCKTARKLWQRVGMSNVVGGIGLNPPLRHYYLQDELTAEQEEALKRKKKGEKKGGKDDKKAPPKKEDPKKKKDDNKQEYKVAPLSKVSQNSLLEEQNPILGEYSLQSHPNYHSNNVYQRQGLLFIRTYFRHLGQQLVPDSAYSSSVSLPNFDTIKSELPFIDQLAAVLDSYAPLSTQHLKICLHSCVGLIHKLSFCRGLTQLLHDTPKNYLQLVKKPHQDLPLNSSLINVPAYSEFIASSRSLLEQAKAQFKKCLTLLENSTVFYERGMGVEDVAWHYADAQCMLAEYTGRDKPKYYPSQDMSEAIEEIQLSRLNNISEGSLLLDQAIRIRNTKFELTRNYLQIGGKPLDPAVKIDQDIVTEITEMDKESKKAYPQFLTQNYKGKPAPTGTDLITYMLKVQREAEFMTFSSPSYQNVLFKLNRILSKGLQGYKDKCVTKALVISAKKSVKEKFVEEDTVTIKSIRYSDAEVFLYVLGPVEGDETIEYGRVTIELATLSKLTEELLALATRAAISDGKSENVKKRDYTLHRRQFVRVLGQLSLPFGNTDSEGELRVIPEEQLVELTTDNLNTVTQLLDTNGLSVKNKNVCKYLRYLHRIKYKLSS